MLSRLVPESRAERPALRRPDLTGREPARRTGYLIRQPVRSYLRHLWLFRFVNEAPETPARFQRINTQRRNRFTPMDVRRPHCTSGSKGERIPTGYGPYYLRFASGARPSDGSLHLTIVFALTEGVPFVDGGFPFSQRDLDLRLAVFEIHLERDEG